MASGNQRVACAVFGKPWMAQGSPGRECCSQHQAASQEHKTQLQPGADQAIEVAPADPLQLYADWSRQAVLAAGWDPFCVEGMLLLHTVACGSADPHFLVRCSSDSPKVAA